MSSSSLEAISIYSSAQHDEEDEHPHSLSRLSLCTSHGDSDDIEMHMEGSNDADEELLFSESDSDTQPGCYSLPSTPLTTHGFLLNRSISESEGARSKMRTSSRRKIIRERCNMMMKAKGGVTSLCMDLSEIKACRDLGLELEIPGRESSISCCSTSSGGNSPIANWRISSPGDDPRDVKARLKVWAQAVAIASSTTCNGN
ncbi:hypothetical protein GIB67_029333 [Kingdonia uniflora]|uniref:Uncharacterized protein n=1 Tax=Kingdonia uniflora TaxID=39325 RepID=A0A7J7N8W7_9MAGN|nr:hypothetical protein GIB67_029333 [Kingdonia uniflora]